MFWKECMSCHKKSRKKFDFCPYCGESFGRIRKKGRSQEDFGLLGARDEIDLGGDIKLPFGMEKMINSLAKQLEKQMNEINFEESRPSQPPKGFRINISAGKPLQVNQVMQQNVPHETLSPTISQKESERRNSLPKVEATSKMKRLDDKILYEIDMPSVKSRDDIVITELATGLEVRGYSKTKCYTKFIPLKIEVLKYELKKEKLFLELKA